MACDPIPGINRNILECKAGRVTESIISSSVLIETYWNVKNVFAAASTWVLAVLIETYWNVKSVMTIFSTHSFSINRNILECKDGKSVVVRRI